MRALQQTTLDGPEGLRLVTDVPVPSPGPGQILIRVTAAGVNFVDLARAHGTFADGPPPPYVAGIEAAGEIVAAGEGTEGLRPGDHVVGATITGGAFAEYAVLWARAAIPVPAGWADDEALGLAVNWPTALAALKPLGHLAPGQTVLITAAAGATGQAALTIAKHLGATVIAVASSPKLPLLRTLGADHVFAASTDDLASAVRGLTGGQGADLVLESTGGGALGSGLDSARRVTGRVVVYGLSGGESSLTNWDLVYRHQVHVIGLNIGVLIQSAPQVFGEVMGDLFRMIASGVLTPTRPTTFALADGPKALRELEARTTVGKLALVP